MLKGMIIHIVIAFLASFLMFGLLLIGNFTNFKQVVLEISLRQTTNFKNNSKIKSSIFLFILHHFIEQRDQMFWGFCRCQTRKLLRHFEWENDTNSRYQSNSHCFHKGSTNQVEKSFCHKLHWEMKIDKIPFVVLFRPWIDIWQYWSNDNKSRKRITGSSERQTFSEINWDWFLCFQYISRSFSFLKSLWVIIYQLTFFNTSKRCIPIVHLSHDLI